MSAPAPLLGIKDLHLTLRVHGRPRTTVQGVTLAVGAGKAVGLVGESGSGKSLTARTVMRLLPPRATASGDVDFDGRSVLAMHGRQLRDFRRSDVAMIHQDPRSAINHVRTIGDFMTEAIRHLPADERLDRAVAGLRDVGIPDGPRRLAQYPHQLSGGLLQRVMIAAALLPEPRLLLADEPTTALDVTTQSEVMAVLSELQAARGLGMLFITHDLDLAAAVTDTLAVMYAGTVVETGPTDGIHTSARHPYTAALMASRPSTTSVTRLRTIPGRPVAAFETGPGCVFVARCPFATAVCSRQRPNLRPVGEHAVACHHAEDLPGDLVPAVADATDAGEGTR